MAERLGRAALRLAILAAVVVASIQLNERLGLGVDPTQWRDRIAPLGWMAPLAYMLAACLRPLLLLPSWIVMTAGGLLFGVGGATLWGVIGFTLGALWCFGLTRFLGRSAIAGRLGARAARIDEAIRRSGTPWIAIYTMIPVTPLTPVHAAAGLTAVPWVAFGVAVAVGVLPRLVLFAYFGDSIAQGDRSEITFAALVLVVASGVGAWVARRVTVGTARARETEEAARDVRNGDEE